MRWILAAWSLPLVVFWGWYFLSAYNLHFGYVMLTRDVHDIVFEIYGETLGIDPASLPGLVARACILDTVLLFTILAFRRRAALSGWLKSLRRRYSDGISPGVAMISVASQRPQPVEHALKNEGGSGRIDLAGAFAAREIHLDQCALGGDRR